MPQFAHPAKPQFQIAKSPGSLDNSLMPLRILIAPDKFKGTLTAAQAAQAIARGWRRVRPRDQLQRLPMSDGGDGFGVVISSLLGARSQRVKTVDAAHRPLAATWWWEARSKTAIVESAGIIGLAMLPPGKFHPFELDTFGLGAVLRAAQRKGAKQILLGIGGSATNDGGFGLARALGWEFRGARGRLIERWTDLPALVEIHPPKFRRLGKIIVAVDVQNPLLGVRGATRVYGPQKGLRAGDFADAEKSLRRLARTVQRQFNREDANQPGAGAAGGLGFGLAAFLGARLEPGFDVFANYAHLAHRLATADLVITGEGAIDRSTGMGKGVGQLAERCHAQGIPCLGLAGMALRSRETERLFAQLHGLTDITSPTRAKAKPALWLERLAVKAGKSLPVAG